MYLEDPNVNYYEETCKLYIANVVMMTQLKELIAEKNELQAKLSKYEVIIKVSSIIILLEKRSSAPLVSI